MMRPERVAWVPASLILFVSWGMPAEAQQAAPEPAEAPSTRPEDVLKEKGLKRSGTTWLLPVEATFLKEFRDAQGILQEVTQGMMQQQALALGGQDRKVYTENLRQMRTNLSQQLEQLDQQRSQLVEPPGGNNFVRVQQNEMAQQHNRIVAELNQVTDQLSAIQAQDADRDQDPQLQLNAEVANRKETFFQAVIDLRKLADEIQAKYKALADDQNVKAALASLTASTKLRQKLGPSAQFLAALKRLEKSEGAVKSDTIELQREGGVFHVTAMLNGKVPVRMVFDTGAGVTTISSKIANRIGLKPKQGDSPISLRTADGSTVEARRTVIPSVRVGKFTVTNVECAVMPAEKGDVDPLLGQSFFRNFKVEFNADARKLGLKRLETAETAAATATDDTDDDSRPAAKASAKSKRAARQPRTTARGKRSTRGRQAPPPDGFDSPTDGGELPD